MGQPNFISIVTKTVNTVHFEGEVIKFGLILRNAAADKAELLFQSN